MTRSYLSEWQDDSDVVLVDSVRSTTMSSTRIAYPDCICPVGCPHYHYSAALGVHLLRQRPCCTRCLREFPDHRRQVPAEVSL
jgi:transposase-like protein